jgi:hypothetical protein
MSCEGCRKLYNSNVTNVGYLPNCMMESFPSSEGKIERKESSRAGFLAYSKNSLGETLARFYDKTSGAEFAVDRASLETRIRNLQKEGQSANVSESVLNNWPSGNDLSGLVK